MDQNTFWQWKSEKTGATHNIHFIEKGSGSQNIVLIHGFGAHSYTWRYLVDFFADSGFHVWSLDLIGFGLSDKPLNAPYGLGLFVSLVNDFMIAHNITSASLIGNSMGGGIALAMAIYHPKHVESLVLIDCFVFPIRMPPPFILAKILGKLCKPFMTKNNITRILKTIMFDHKKITAEQVDAYYAPLETPGGKDAIIYCLKTFRNSDLKKISDYLNDLSLPILIIWGANDTWMPMNYHQKVIQTLPSAHDVVIPSCGHIPQEECPQQVQEAILNFFKK